MDTSLKLLPRPPLGSLYDHPGVLFTLQGVQSPCPKITRDDKVLVLMFEILPAVQKALGRASNSWSSIKLVYL